MKAHDLIGKKFGKWTVLSREPNWSNASKTCIFSVWLCECECGNKGAVYGTSLTRGRSISCGCVKKQTKYIEGASFGRLFDSYKNNAKRRKILFDLTDREFLELVSAPCYYTGRKPYRNYSHKRRDGKTPDPFTYNGIDRLDPSKGYSMENCVPCCFEVNRAKSDMSEKEFMNLIEDIHAHARRTDQP